LPLDHPWRKNKRTFDGNQELKYEPDVPSGYEILSQLEGMIFGDENDGKSKPESSNNKGEKWKKNTPNKQLPYTNHVVLEKKNIFFRLSY
jgi:hypothetical protein